MGATIRSDGNLALPLKGISARDLAGVLRVANTGRIRDAGGTLRLVFTTLKGSVTPATINKTQGFMFAGATRTITTPAATINVEGGVPPYTFAWTRLSGAADIAADTPAGPTTTFTATLTAPEHVTAVYEGKATDSVGATFAGQVAVDINFVNT
jgi:hypothetical protein